MQLFPQYAHFSVESGSLERDPPVSSESQVGGTRCSWNSLWWWPAKASTSSWSSCQVSPCGVYVEMSKGNVASAWFRTTRRVKSSLVEVGTFPVGVGVERHVAQHPLPYAQVPGPKALPFVGNSWRFFPRLGPFQIEHLDEVSKNLHRRYGNVVKVDGLYGRPDMLFLFNPSDVETIFRAEDLMPFRPSMPSLDYYKHVHRKTFFDGFGGVIAVHGEKWQNFRSKVNKILLQPKVAKMYAKTIEDAAEEFVQRISKLRDENCEVPADFLNELHKWSLESIARVALDVRLGCLDDNSPADTQLLIDAINTFFVNVPVLELRAPFWRLFKNPMVVPSFRKYIESLDVIKEICVRHTEVALKNLNCRSSQKQRSILQRILEQDNDSRIAAVLAFDMFLVGIDTTSNAVASILYQLATHPEKLNKLHEEISSFDKNESFTDDKLERMVYLKACIKETLRKYPVVIGNGRTTTRDYIIGGYHVPKGVQAIFQHFVISNSDEQFPNSDQFLPERWLKSNVGQRVQEQEIKCPQHHSFATLPFGYGKRMCLGRRFADLEIQMLVAKIVQRYKIEYHHEPLDYHVHPMYTPNGALKLRFLEWERKSAKC